MKTAVGVRHLRAWPSLLMALASALPLVIQIKLESILSWPRYRSIHIVAFRSNRPWHCMIVLTRRRYQPAVGDVIRVCVRQWEAMGERVDM